MEDYNAFRVERRGGVGQSSPTDYKVGLWGIDCQFTTKEEGGEGGEIMKISRGLMRGSSKHDTTSSGHNHFWISVSSFVIG